MGKIKIATLGSENEEELRKKQEVRREEKKKRQEAAKGGEKVHISGMKGGQRIKSVELSEAEIERMAKLTEEVEEDEKKAAEGKTEVVKKKKKKVAQRTRGKRYKEALMKVDHKKVYAIAEAVPLLRQISITKFDPTVELHINTIEKGLRGAVKLPHGTGKEVKVEIADNSTIDKIISQVEKGQINFDILVAHPQVMGKLAKIAKFLGPKGLMPNPKAGTISPEPEKIAEKFKGGEINWKTEADFPLIHQRIGKLSFKDKQIEENFQAFVKSIGAVKISSVTLKSTMSPGIRVSVEL